MRQWSYIIIVFFVNYVLFESFPFGGSGTGLGLLLTIPLIIIITLAITFIHYYLKKKNKQTKYFQIIGTIIVTSVSYFLFIAEPDNTPLHVIRRMIRTARVYNKITINDFFLENRYYNYERIVAAKKKFHHQIFDTAFFVRINNVYNYNSVSENFGIMYSNGKPFITKSNVRIGKVEKDTFKFEASAGNDTITFYGNASFISDPINRTDSFMNFGAGYSKDATIKHASTGLSLKNDSPDNDYWAYKILYWLL